MQRLTQESVQADSRHLNCSASRLPTLVQTVKEAHEVVMLATGSDKALDLQKCIESKLSQNPTLSALQRHRKPLIVADKEATQELHMKTVQVEDALQASLISNVS